MNLTKGKRDQFVIAAMDNDRVTLTKKCQKAGNSPDLCSESVKMTRAEVLQQKIYQSGFLRRPETRQ